MPRVLAALMLLAFVSLVAISRLCPDAGPDPGVAAGPPAPHAAADAAPEGHATELVEAGRVQRWMAWQEAQDRDMLARIEALEARLATVSPR